MKGSVFEAVFVRSPRVLLVTDGSGWVIDGVSESLCANIPKAYKGRVTQKGWQRVRNTLIHFIDRRWAWADGVLDKVHASNALIALWWHGKLDSPDPAIPCALKRLKTLQQRFARVQVTCETGRQTLRTLGIDDSKIAVLPEGVDTQRFVPAPSRQQRQVMRRQLDIPEGKMAVGCFQKDGDGWQDGLSPKLIKGPDIFAAVMERLSRRYPVHAVIPGPARGYLKEQLKKRGVSFSAPGFINAKDWPAVHQTLDIYLCSSRDEGGPAGVLESMASGIPVVSTAVGMPADIIRTRENGWLAANEDIAGLAEGVSFLLDSPDAARRMAAAARQTIEGYDWRVLGRRYAHELYDPLLERMG